MFIMISLSVKQLLELIQSFIYHVFHSFEISPPKIQRMILLLLHYTIRHENVSQSNVTPTVCECSFEIVTKSMKPDFDKYTQTKQKCISIKCNTNCL